MHVDAHPGIFMLIDGTKMGVIDFGAVAPMPGGFPAELGAAVRYARDKDYDKVIATMRQGGFIQKGQEVSVREIDEMLRQYVEPVQVEVFHYSRKWLMRMAGKQLERPVEQLKTARQLDLPPKLAMPMRVLASTTAIMCQLDAHVPVKRLSEEYVPGFTA
jgi:predicted unusual protein kinase regulating ubiquinone biosynthesis (AarF/ABC1/UbiB family)